MHAYIVLQFMQRLQRNTRIRRSNQLGTLETAVACGNVKNATAHLEFKTHNEDPTAVLNT